MKYTFNVTLNDNTVIQYQASNYQALYEYIYNDKRKSFEMYDIKKVELIRKYIFVSFLDNKKYIKEVNESLYTKLSNEYEMYANQKFASLDAYIKFALACNT
jgi:hypothetical protein